MYAYKRNVYNIGMYIADVCNDLINYRKCFAIKIISKVPSSD